MDGQRVGPAKATKTENRRTTIFGKHKMTPKPLVSNPLPQIVWVVIDAGAIIEMRNCKLSGCS